MALIVCPECNNNVSSRANLCPHCGYPISEISDTSLSVPKAAEIQDAFPKESVVEHLTHAKNLEETIFMYRRAKGFLLAKINQLGISRDIPSPPKISYNFYFWTTFFISFFAGLILSCSNNSSGPADIFLIATVIPLFFGSEYLWTDLGIALGIALFFTCLIGILYVIVKKVEYNEVYKVYQKKVNADKFRVAEELKQADILKKQCREIDVEIRKNEDLLSRLYAIDILYPTYRNMVAVITMLDYFKSGRCSQLTGGHGAYDTYSNELLQKTIIGKLDMVISQLEQIKQNQYMLYQAVQEANETALQIYRQSEKIIESNHTIEQNTALAAYNSTVTRRNTTISAYINAFGR